MLVSKQIAAVDIHHLDVERIRTADQVQKLFQPVKGKETQLQKQKQDRKYDGKHLLKDRTVSSAMALVEKHAEEKQ